MHCGGIESQPKAAIKPGVLEIIWPLANYASVCMRKRVEYALGLRSNNHKVMILAFYFSDPVPLFLVYGINSAVNT